jgi:hypothetical protein
VDALDSTLELDWPTLEPAVFFEAVVRLHKTAFPAVSSVTLPALPERGNCGGLRIGQLLEVIVSVTFDDLGDKPLIDMYENIDVEGLKALLEEFRKKFLCTYYVDEKGYLKKS